MQQKLTRNLTFFCLLVFAALAVNAQELKLEILNGHSGGGALTVAVSADGKLALTGGEDWTALLWDLETGRQLRRFAGYHEDAVSAVAFSKDNQFVLTAGYDKTLQLWETATGRRVRGFGGIAGGAIVGHTGSITFAAISPDDRLVATAGEDQTARLWDLRTGRQLFKIDHAAAIGAMAFSPDSKFLLTGGADGLARLFSTDTGEPVKSFAGHTGRVAAVAYSPDGKRVLTGGADRAIRLWDAATAKEVKKLEFALPIHAAGFAPDGKSVFAAHRNPGYAYEGEKKFAVLKDIDTTREIWSAADEVFSFAFTPDGKKILILSEGEAKTVEVSAPHTRVTLKGKTTIVNSVAASPDAVWLLTGGIRSTSTLWNLTTGRTSQPWERALPGQTEDWRTVKFSGDSKRFAFASGDGFGQDGDIQIFETETLAQSFKEPMECSAVALSERGNRVFCNAGGNRALLFDFEAYVKAVTPDEKKAAIRALLVGGEGMMTDAAFSPDEKIVAAADEDNAVHLWNAETGAVKLIVKDFRAPVWSVAFSPDGKTLAAASGDEVDMAQIGIGDAANANAVRLFDVATGRETGSFGQIFESVVNKFTGFKSVAYSPDGKYIAAGSFDGKVYLRDNLTKTVRKFEGHTDIVNSVKFAKDVDGTLLVVSGSSDSTTRIWNAATGEEICALVTFRDGNWAVVQTKTGRYDAPNGGEIAGIQWVFGNEVIALSQLKDIYYTPNLLPRLLGYNKEPLADVRPLKNIKLFPEIVERNLDKATTRLIVKLKNRGGGIGAVRVMVNGSLAAEDARSAELIAKLKANPNTPEAVVTLNLKGSAGFNLNGENKIEVITNDYDEQQKKSFVSSDPQSSSRGTEIFDLGDTGDQPIERTLYAIVGGVSDYNGTALDLNFAAKDAEDFANALGVAARGLFCPKENPQCDRVKIRLLTTPPKGAVKDSKELPTKANFRAAFADVAKTARHEDVLVVYLAGHGTSLNVGDAETYFFLTQESEVGSKDAVGKNPERAISNAEILDWLTQEKWTAEQKGIRAENKVLILDTCAAGAFENVLTKDKQRDLSADQIKALEKLKDRTGLQILMGSAANQSAYEASQYGQGLLTYALLEGIRSAAWNNKNIIETGALFKHAVESVPKMDIGKGSSGLQAPRTFGATSIPVGLMTVESRKAIKILESPLPVFGKPFIFQKDENFDTLGLINRLALKLDAAGEAQTRGGENLAANSLVYIDDDNYPGAFRVTGTYAAEANGAITIEAVLRKDGKVFAPLDKITGTDADEASEKLFLAILKKLTEK